MSHSDGARFATTRWSLVVAAADSEHESARTALAELCADYWYPLYVFARRSGSNHEDARDLTQGFFAELLDKHVVAQADRERGRFRTFLLAAFRHFASRQRERDRALKRGGGEVSLSLDYGKGEERYVAEPADPSTPDRLYERRWAMELLARVLRELRDEYEKTRRGDLFAELEPLIGGAAPAKPYAEIATRMGMTETAVKVAAHRLKRRYRDRLHLAVAATVADPGEVDDELRQLIIAVSAP